MKDKILNLLADIATAIMIIGMLLCPFIAIGTIILLIMILGGVI